MNKLVQVSILWLLFFTGLCMSQTNSASIESDTQKVYLNLQKALEWGLEKNFGLKIAKLQAQKTENQRKEAIGALLPNLNGEAALNWTSNDSLQGSGSSNVYSQNLGLRANWTLFDGFGMFYNLSASKKGLDLSRLSYQIEIENTTVQIIQLYMGVVVKYQFYQAALKQWEVSKNRLDRTLSRRELGGASSRELLSAQVALNTDLSQKLSRELDYQLARRNLNLALGRSSESGFSLDSILKVPQSPRYTLEEYLKKTKTQGKQLERQKLLDRIESLRASMAASALWPKLQLRGGLDWRTQGQTSDVWLSQPDIFQQQVGATLTLPLFNNFSTITKTQNARLEAKAQELRTDELLLNLESLVIHQWETLQNRLQIISFEKETVQLAEKNLTVLEEQYKLGAVTNLELREGQTQLLDAKNRLTLAEYEAITSYIELERMSGSIDISVLF